MTSWSALPLTGEATGRAHAYQTPGVPESKVWNARESESRSPPCTPAGMPAQPCAGRCTSVSVTTLEFTRQRQRLPPQLCSVPLVHPQTLSARAPAEQGMPAQRMAEAMGAPVPQAGLPAAGGRLAPTWRGRVANWRGARFLRPRRVRHVPADLLWCGATLSRHSVGTPQEAPETRSRHLRDALSPSGGRPGGPSAAASRTRKDTSFRSPVRAARAP